MSIIGRYRKWYGERQALTAWCGLVNLHPRWHETNSQRRKRVHAAIEERWQRDVTMSSQRPSRRRWPW